MKKFLTLAVLLGAFIFSAHAQRSIHLKPITNVNNGDTLVIDSVNEQQYIIALGVVNQGPNAGQAGDTLFMRRPYQTRYYILQSTDAPYAMGDTIKWFIDTVAFGTGPATGTMNWCDSAWLTSGSTSAATTITDPTPSSYCESIHIVNNNGKTGILSVGLDKASINIYPNPASETVNFSYDFAKPTNVNIRIMDLTGRTLKTMDMGRANVGDQSFKIDVASLPEGTYMLEFTTEDARAITKFIKR